MKFNDRCERRGGAVSSLKEGFDYRLQRYRREVFLRFYQAHLYLKAHPGLVYLILPYLVKTLGLTQEESLWLAFINGNTQNPVTTQIIFEHFTSFKNLNALERWFAANYTRLEFDTDRKWQKKSFIEAAAAYKKLCGSSQVGFFELLLKNSDEGVNWKTAWSVLEPLPAFGRLSTFSYTEYLRIVGLPVLCNDLLLEDMGGSKSHRNGLSKVLGRDDWDWHKSNPCGFSGSYTPAMLSWLKAEGATLLKEARRRFKKKTYSADVNYFTLESALCTYKSWFRKNRRYGGVYIDMHYNRLLRGQDRWPRFNFAAQWKARRTLPLYFLMEHNLSDPGLKPVKQNHFRETGQVIMLDYWWPEFANDFNRKRALEQGQVYRPGEGGSL